MSNASSQKRNIFSHIKFVLIHSSLASQIIVLYFCVILCVFFFLFSVLMKLERDTAQQRTQAQNETVLKYAETLIEKEQQHISGLAEYYSSSLEAQRVLQQSNNGLAVSDNDIQEILQSTRFRMYLLSVVYYNLAGEPVGFVSIDNSYDPYPQGRNTPFYRLLYSHQDSEWEYIPSYSSRFMGMDHSPKLVYWKRIQSSSNQKNLGVVAVTIDIRRIFISNTDSNSIPPVALFTEGGEQILNRSEYQFNSDEVDYMIQTAQKRTIAYEKMDNDWNIYYLHCINAPIICSVAMKGSSATGQWNFLFSTIMVLGLFALLLFPLIWLSSKMLTRRLKALSNSMVQFSTGDYSATVDIHQRDEVSQLEAVFNHMVEENQRLIEESYIMKLREKEAELMILQAQINPHFLYNTLNSIFWSATKHNDDETAQAIFDLSIFLRLSLNRGKDWMPIQECLELTSYYLKLQKRRFGDRLDWIIDCAPELKCKKIPKLIIQPIVENAVVHGMGFSTLHIRIGIYSEDGMLHIEIEDDGKGIPEDILERLPDKLPETKEAGGYAIWNINERLRILYKQDFQFVTESRVDEGTKVHIAFPLQTEEIND